MLFECLNDGREPVTKALVKGLLRSCLIEPGDRGALGVERNNMTRDSQVPFGGRNEKKERTFLARMQRSRGAVVGASGRVAEQQGGTPVAAEGATVTA